jgi:hypothetical protein
LLQGTSGEAQGFLSDKTLECYRLRRMLQSSGEGDLPTQKPQRRWIDLVRYDRAGQETRRWTLHGAWIKVLEYDDLEGGNTENSIEKLTLSYHYWSG